MITVNIHEAKTNLSKLLAMVEQGQTITIAKAGRPIATIQPIAGNKPKRIFGSMKDEIWVADDFDAPLPEDILAGFEPNDENWYQYFELDKDKNVSDKKKKTKLRKKHR